MYIHLELHSIITTKRDYMLVSSTVNTTSHPISGIRDVYSFLEQHLSSTAVFQGMDLHTETVNVLVHQKGLRRMQVQHDALHDLAILLPSARQKDIIAKHVIWMFRNNTADAITRLGSFRSCHVRKALEQLSRSNIRKLPS